jgi:hypothetical protein
MKRIILLSFLATISFLYSASQVGIGTATPDSSAQLELSSTNKGFLPPRVALTATNIAAPVASPAVGLLIYNTATGGASPTNVAPGYYYWNGSIWYPVVNKGTTPGDMQYWNGSRWINIPLGLNGQHLTICNGIPIWGDCTNTITIAPSNNPQEGIIASNTPNTSVAQFDELFLGGWTVSGNVSNTRYLVKFDLSAIPANAVIDSAKLFLYADSTPIAGNMIDAHSGNSNAFYIQRITSSWTMATTWNTAPATTTANQVLLPQSTSSFQNEMIDVTALIQDIKLYGNNGLLMKLQTEVQYNMRQYVSSFDNNAARRPRLVITYH